MKFEDLTGKIFGKLTVLKMIRNPNGSYTPFCKCECGCERETKVSRLKSGMAKTCGSALHKSENSSIIGKGKRQYFAEVGDVFNSLTLVKFEHSLNKKGGQLSLFKCKCGEDKIATLNVVKKGLLKSCGCRPAEAVFERLDKKVATSIGQKFGKLTVIKSLGLKNKAYTMLCECSCKDKNTREVRFKDLSKMKVLSCGCGGPYPKMTEEERFKYATIAARASIWCALKRKGFRKTKQSVDYLGCDFVYFKSHLESKFTEGMSWENHGNKSGQWEIDHIIPVDYAEAEEDLFIIGNYRNLTPLCEAKNGEKSSALPENVEQKFADLKYRIENNLP